MDKHSYETYEFLTTTPADSDSNQFFVLQEDGTILTINKEVQYITQVENVKDAIEGENSTQECGSVFDVSSQQYYVDVEGNAPEMITINEQYAIANGENNVYTNNYLIEPESSSTIQQMETETIIDPQKLDLQQQQQLNNDSFDGAKQTNDLTEVTLSDEQYHILETKGWLLLESNDKIYVLNTLGLHDITTNHKLIEQLKNALENDESASNSEIGQLKIESVTREFPIGASEENTPKQEDKVVEFFIEKNNPLPPERNVQFVSPENKDEELNEPDNLERSDFIEVELPSSLSKPENNTDKSSETQKQCDSIKIKTKCTFKDIPDKIFLGKMLNGKNLYAKVKSVKKGKYVEKVHKSQEILYGKKIDKIRDVTSLDSALFINLIQDSFRDMTKLNPLTISYASAIVSQLLRLSNVSRAIVGSNLILTKLTTFETNNGKEIGQPTMVTGTVKVVDGEETFIHVPLLLQTLLNEAEDKNMPKGNSASLPPEEKTAKDVIDLFHIHVSEIRYIDKPLETSINFSKRKLPLDVLTDAKKRHPNPVHGCGSCGAVFKSECLLKDHQKEQCIETDDKLTIDTDELNVDKEILYTVIENGKEKMYSCTLCETKFSRLFNCQKHIKAHKTGIEKKLKVYKCKMCPKSFFHSSSLSKHIKEHLQMQPH